MAATLNDLIANFRDNGVEWEPEQLLDALWLAARGFAGGPAMTPPPEPVDVPESAAPETAGTPASGSTSTPTPTTEETTAGPSDAIAAGVYGLRGSGETRMRGHPLGFAASPLIARGIEFDRAFRPLRQRRPLAHSLEVDEEATVTAWAAADFLHPVMRPRRGRWLDIALVIEQSPTMRLWHDVALEFRRMVSRSCSPRTLRTYYVRWTPRALIMSTSGGSAVSLHSPVRGAAETVVFVVSDAMSYGWLTADVPEWIVGWSAKATTALVQVLPDHMWKRTALRRVRWTQVAPGPQACRSERNRSEWPRIPVVTIEPGAVGQFARFMALHDPRGVLGYSGSRHDFRVVDRETVESSARVDTTTLSDERIAAIFDQFQQHASPEARRLALHLASAPLLLPVMRLVQRVLVPDASPSQLAEIVLSGLLYRSTTPPRSRPDESSISYEFLPGIRERLLDLGGLECLHRTVELLSRYFQDRLGSANVFASLLADPAGAAREFSVATVGAEAQPFAHLTETLLKRLGYHVARTGKPAPGPLGEADQSRSEFPPPGGLPEQILLSCVSDEFEKRGAPFEGLRSDLRNYLERAGCHVIAQEDAFPPSGADTVVKLDLLISRADAVIHLVGGLPGALASKEAVTTYFASQLAFLANHPELRADLGDCFSLTYTQWEAILALHHGVRLFVYATEKVQDSQATHLQRLRRAYIRYRYVFTRAELFGQLIGDLGWFRQGRFYIAASSRDFEQPYGRFPGLRSRLRQCLARAKCHVVSQEDLPQGGGRSLLHEIDGLLKGCDALIQLVGQEPGPVPAPRSVADYLRSQPGFLSRYAELRDALGDCMDLPYPQWEACIALHHDVPVFFYATDEARNNQEQYLQRLRLAGRYPAPFTNEADLLGQLLGDFSPARRTRPEEMRKIASSRILQHAPDRLFGREKWLESLDAAWANPRLNVYVMVSWGGIGKTSLVAHWVSQRLAAMGWLDVEHYFDWSFDGQGTGEARQGSSDLFMQEALRFFGDPSPASGTPWERGDRLAELIRRHRTLLILDGIESLQYPPVDPQAGRLRDSALESLLLGLAADNRGLCIVTTREHLKNLEGLATVEEHKLEGLSKEAGVALLRSLNVVGAEAEFEAAWKDAGGHALTLQLLGRYLANAHGGDIRFFRELRFDAAERESHGRSAFRVMLAYEKWLQAAGPERQRALAILRLTGLFDRSIPRNLLQVLCARPAIRGLTDTLVNLKDAQWNTSLARLGSMHLLTVTSEAIDAHALIREYFARQLRETWPAAFREAHSRLFDHLCQAAPHRPDTLDGLQPLYQALFHGCLAGRGQEACVKVYIDRILRGLGSDGYYSTRKLGAIGANLGGVAAFFDEPWNRLSRDLNPVTQAWLLNEAAFSLRALGRLTEAVEPMRASLVMRRGQNDWRGAAISAGNLSGLETTLGRLKAAVADGRQAIRYGDSSGDEFRRIDGRVTAADALHQSGQRAEAGALFAEAERIQQQMQPEFDLLYSVSGFQYGDWLLARAEATAWQVLLRGSGVSPAAAPSIAAADAASCVAVERRATRTSVWAREADSLLAIALDHLTLARIGLYRAILSGPLPQPGLDLTAVADAVRVLRMAGQVDELPRGLLTAALYDFVRGDASTGRARLDEAQEIAERGPMPLYLADIHLHRARLFRDLDALTRAGKLIRDLGYGRRRGEFNDARKALAGT
jgi:hypothetical protein